MLRESLNEATRREVGRRNRRTLDCACNAESSQRPYDAKGIMCHQNCGLEDGVILLRLPKREEGAARCQDLLNLLVAREIANDGLIDGRGSLDRQGIHEHGRSRRHIEGLERSLSVIGCFRSRASSMPSLFESLPEFVHLKAQVFDSEACCN